MSNSPPRRRRTREKESVLAQRWIEVSLLVNMVPKIRLNEAEDLLEKELKAVVRDWQAEQQMLGWKVRR